MSTYLALRKGDAIRSNDPYPIYLLDFPVHPENTYFIWGSITVPLASYLIGFDSAALLYKN